MDVDILLTVEVDCLLPRHGGSDSATRGCEVGNPSVVMDLDVEEKAREIRLRFCGAISGKEAYRYAPERLGRSGRGTKPRGRAKRSRGIRGSGWGKPFLAGTQRSSDGPRELGWCHCEPSL